MMTAAGIRKILFLSTLCVLFCIGAVHVSGQRPSQPTVVKVVDQDLGSGVESDICIDNAKYPDCPVEKRIGSTNPNGEWSNNYSCGSADKVFARPTENAYHSSNKFSCMPNVMQVTLRTTSQALMDFIAKADAEGNFAVEALVANEVAARLSDPDPKIAEQYEIIAYQSAAKALNVGVATVVDQEQGKTVMSPDLKDKVATFQTQKNIYSPSDRRLGRLDYATLSNLSGTSLSSTLKASRSSK